MPSERRDDFFPGDATAERTPRAPASGRHVVAHVSPRREPSSLIPLPRTARIADVASHRRADCCKGAKTERNRLRLILRRAGEREIVEGDEEEEEKVEEDDGAEKRRKIGIESYEGRRAPLENTTGSRCLKNNRRHVASYEKKEETIPQQTNRTSAFFDAFRNSARAPRVESDSYDPYDARETRGAPQCLLVPPSDPPLAGGAVVVKPVALVHASTEPRKRSKCASSKANVENVSVWPRTVTTTSKVNKEDVMEPELKEEDERKSDASSAELYTRSRHYDEDASSEEENSPVLCSQSQRLSSLYHGTWPVERSLWIGQHTGLSNQQSTSTTVHNDMASVMSFSSSSGTGIGYPAAIQGQRRLGAKVDVVYSLLGMLGGTEGREDMSATLLSMSNSVDNCLAMRQSGCLPLLVQLIHAPGQDPETRERASQALHNVVHARNDERARRREARVLRLLEQLRDYCRMLRTSLEMGRVPDDSERHPGPTIAALMKLSFDEAHRHAMCQFGGLHAVAELIEMDHAAHGSECDDHNSVTLRRYAGMALTNLTFGDGNNKALLCSFREFMRALVAQLRSPSDDLRQVTASVLRNLSWRADSSSKQTLREVGAVTGLTKAAMEGRKESTLKSILSALWNLSAHCSTNKVDICAVEGALAFLADMLSYKAPSKTLAIVENAGGILRNVSSHVAIREDYRSILRERGCLQVLLRQLRSPSLTVVSNACGALWNLSARCAQDQRLLWDLGAVPMLRSLVHSKHKMISMGSSAALKNLLSARPGSGNIVHLDSTTRGLGLSTLPSLVARRQKALEQELDQNLAETCDNIEPSTSPTNKDDKFAFKVDRNFGDLDVHTGCSYQIHDQPGTSGARYSGVARSESRESMRSITSTHSDTIFERVNRHVLNGSSPTEAHAKHQSSSLHSAVGFGPGMSADGGIKGNRAERKYVLRYKNADQLKPSSETGPLGDLRCTTSTVSWACAPDHESICSQMLLNSSVEDSLSLAGSSKQPAAQTEERVQDSSGITADNSASSDFQDTSAKPTIVPASFAKSRAKTGIDPKEFADCNALSLKRDINLERNVYSDYAETDLDQLTDYSLRYAERPSDDEEKRSSLTSVNSDVEREFTRGDVGKKFWTEEMTLEMGEFFNVRKEEQFDGASKRFADISGIPSTKLTPNGTAVPNEMQNKLQNYEKNFTVENIASTNDDQRANKDVNSLNVRSEHYSTNLSPLGSINGYRQVMLDHDPSRNSGEATVSGDTPRSAESVTAVSDSNNSSSDIGIALAASMDSISLTSGTTDDEPKIVNDSKHKELRTLLGTEQNVCSTLDEGSHTKIVDQVSDGDDEEDEDLLAACINIGMQNNRHRQSFRRCSFQKANQAASTLSRYQTSNALDQVEINTLANSTDEKISNVVPEIAIVPDGQRGTGNASSSLDNDYNAQHDTQSLPVERIAERDATASREDDVVSCKSSDFSSNENEMVSFTADNTADRVSFLSAVDGRSENYFSLSATSDSNNVASTRVRTKDEGVVQASQFNFESINDRTSGENDAATSGPNSIIYDGTGAIISDQRTAVSTDSESFDSVERSEHALLKLCIQAKTPANKNIPVNGLGELVTFSAETSHIDTAESLSETKESSTGELAYSGDDTDHNLKERANEERIDYGASLNIDPMLAAVDKVESREEHTRHTVEEEYKRQKDPDAMIASLDRLTATLVQQTEAMREREMSAMKQSVVSDVWNEDSPNDISYPSISVSAPLIASFKSDAPEEQAVATNEQTDSESNKQTNMSESKIIEREAILLAEAVKAEAGIQSLDLDAISMTSIDLDAIKPPSTMGSLLSLTTSLIGTTDVNEISVGRDRCHSASLPPMQIKSQAGADCRGGRKKSLPAGVVARRALGQGQNHTGSLENLLNESSTGTQLENIKPPSMMDELLDAADMENSMLSVASITSEIADSRDPDSHSLTSSDPVFDLLKPVANVLSITCMRYAESMQTSGNNSLSECLENINPPSLFNEVSDMDESTVEPASDTVFNDTLCTDTDDFHTEEAPHLGPVERIEEAGNDTDDATTPIPTEYCVSSSAESTPKKRLSKNHITPKQKRQLAKERYKTYTIAAEMVKKEEEERRKQDHMDHVNSKSNAGKCSPFSKLTPKQRRQEDRARFQTQVLDNPFPESPVDTASDEQRGKEGDNGCLESTEVANASSTVKSGIPTFKKFSVCKTTRLKHAENKENRERYRTRTLDNTECALPRDSNDLSRNSTEIVDARYVETMLNITPEEMETMIEQNANIVLNTLNETNKHSGSIGEEAMLDCETLSLVSIESETERCLKLRSANGLPRSALPRQIGTAQVFCGTVGGKNQTAEEEIVQQEELAEERRNDETADIPAEVDDGSNNADEKPRTVKGPRIIKPGAMSRDASVDSNTSEKSEPGSPKAIRGRRKMLYSNPITRRSTPQSSPSKQAGNVVSGIPIGRSNTSPVVRSTRAVTLRQNNNSISFATRGSQKSNSSPKIIPPSATGGDKKISCIAVASNKSSIPQKGSTFTYAKAVRRYGQLPNTTSIASAESKKDALAKPLERQGTFTKDEPEVENAPTVLPPASPGKSRIAKPVKNSLPKAYSTFTKPKTSVRTHSMVHQSKLTTMTTTAKEPSPKALRTAQTRKPPTGSTTEAIRTSSSNQSLQSLESGKIARKVTSLGQRSNSNSSIVSNSASSPQGRRLAKEATSKIASLWKKVEENRNKQLHEKSDTRQWIAPASCAAETDESDAANNTSVYRLIRSSTFEGMPINDASNNAALYAQNFREEAKISGGIRYSEARYRNSCDLSGMNVSEAPCKVPSKFIEPRSHKKDETQVANGVAVLRKQQNPEVNSQVESDVTKRVSRLGSFVRVDPTEAEGTTQPQINSSTGRTPASAVVPPFNYNPKQSPPLQRIGTSLDESDDKPETTVECQMEIITGSMRVTTV